MSKIYGYKEEDVINLAKFLKKEKGGKLIERFEKFASINGKAKGTVRNLYYALAKMSNADEAFCNKYLGGEPLKVEKIVEFSECEERQLIKKILIGKAEGKSVRSIIKQLSNGDEKTALRFQNKYRTAVTRKTYLINQVKEELKQKGIKIAEERKTSSELIPDWQLLKLKSEINNLVLRIASKERKENEILKNRVLVLERENLRLSSMLNRNDGKFDALKFFRAKSGEGVVH